MAVLYALSGITIVKSDEVALILRWGRLMGATPALQQHGPGLLFALPRPIDEVLRVPVKHVWQASVSTLNADPARGELTLDPLVDGYALTGDRNIVHVDMEARYRVRDPAEWAFYGPKSEDVLRVEVTQAMTRSLGEMGVDRVLSDGRKTLIAIATRRAQAALDAAHAGIELSSLELKRLAPPRRLAADFDAVQSAFIEAETMKNDAHAFAETAIPRARADADTALQAARGAADTALANAEGDAEAFLALDKEYRANRGVVRERLYRSAVERAFRSARNIQWIPPPAGARYHGLRITLASTEAGPPNSSDGSQGEPDATSNSPSQAAPRAAPLPPSGKAPPKDETEGP